MAGAVTLNLRAVDNVSPALRKADASAQKFNRTVERSNGQLKQSWKALLGFKNGAKAAGASAAVATPAILGMGAAVTSALGPIVLIGGAVGILSAAVKTLADQDFAVAKLKSLKVDTDALVPSLKEVSRELGHSASTTELTAAAYDVASAGFTDAGDAAKILKVAVMGARGGFSDLDTAASATVKVINAFGATADEAEDLMNKFVQTQNDGIITVDTYAKNIGKVAPVASMMGLKLEEVNAVIAQSTANGVNAEVAFTGLKTAFLRLGGAQGAMKLEKLGIDISASTLASEGLLANLKKLEGLDVTALEQIFGQEAIQTMAPVLNNLEKFEKLLFNQKNAAEIAAKAHEIANNTIQAKWTRISNIMSNMFADQTLLGEALKATLHGLGNALIKIINFFETLARAVKNTIQFIKDLGTEIKALTMNMPNWLKNITGLGTSFESGAAFKESLKKEKEKTEAIKEAAEAIVKTNKELEKTPPAVEKVNILADQLNEKWKEMTLTIKQGVTGAIKGAIQGSQSLGDAMGNVLRRIADQALEVAINMALWGSAGAGGTGGIGGAFLGLFRANGGGVTGGRSYVVGEKGPEIFTPGRSGGITPNNAIKGGATTINVAVDASGSSVEGKAAEGQILGEAIGVAIQKELIRQRLPGGLLY
jgi:TP901 family phage tail tape measure protein